MSTCSAFRRSPALPRGLDWDDQPLSKRLYLLPTGLVSGEQAAGAIVSGNGWPVAEGAMAFTSAGVVWRDGKTAWISLCSFAELAEWSESEGENVGRHMGRLVRHIGARRGPWAGLAEDRPLIMGIINATPDSFSDGGVNLDPAVAVAHAMDMVAAGADIIDVGGESTRPGAPEVSPDEEIRRIRPVVQALAEKGVVVSIDSRHAPVMAAAMEAGARIINDVTALEGDPEALNVAVRTGAALCLMHMRGQPQTMQADPVYECAPLDVYDYLADRIAVCEAAGIPRARIVSDVGIGFGKTLDHNAQLIASLALYHGLGCPILLAASRKTFVAKASKGEPPNQRLAGTLAAHLAGLDAGAQIIRAHDVTETAQAIAVWRAIRSAA